MKSSRPRASSSGRESPSRSRSGHLSVQSLLGLEHHLQPEASSTAGDPSGAARGPSGASPEPTTTFATSLSVFNETNPPAPGSTPPLTSWRSVDPLGGGSRQELGPRSVSRGAWRFVAPNRSTGGAEPGLAKKSSPRPARSRPRGRGWCRPPRSTCRGAPPPPARLGADPERARQRTVSSAVPSQSSAAHARAITRALRSPSAAWAVVRSSPVGSKASRAASPPARRAHATDPVAKAR